MGDSKYSGRFSRSSRSRSRSPFRKYFNERPIENDRGHRRRNSSVERLPKNTVFVNNIPFECRWMELKDLFRDKVGEVTFVELFEDDKGKFSGTGVVEFKDSESAKKAITIMHKFEYKGRHLNVKDSMDERDMRDRGNSSRERGMRADLGFSSRSGGSDFRSGPGFETYGLNPEFLKSLNIQGPLTTKIFISNLDYKVTEKKLEEVFKLAGKMTSMELNLDNEGKSKGHAVGEYELPLEAVQAISMFNGQKLYARVMNVRMDKFADDEPLSKLPSGLQGIGKGLGIGGLPMQFNKGSNASNGSGDGFGMGIGGSGSGLGVGSSGLGLVSSSSLGLSSGDRSMLSSSSLGLGSSLNLGSSMMASSNLSSRNLDSVGGRDPFQLSPVSAGRSFRDSFDGRDSYSSQTLSDTVLLGNLPSSFSWHALKDRCRDLGDVRFAEYKGQGSALLRFASVQEAQRAVDILNNIRLDSRLIQARLY